MPRNHRQLCSHTAPISERTSILEPGKHVPPHESPRQRRAAAHLALIAVARGADTACRRLNLPLRRATNYFEHEVWKRQHRRASACSAIP
jgi:hypothetical protein